MTMKSISIPEPMLKSIFVQAEKEYPHECCGMIMESVETSTLRLCPCQNAQDMYHQLDPTNFPRTSETAYFIDSGQLFKIQKKARENREKIKIIYHSHINAGAYFSEEDTRIALSEGEPVYSGVEYLVVSVVQGKVSDYNLFKWDSTKRAFVT